MKLLKKRIPVWVLLCAFVLLCALGAVLLWLLCPTDSAGNFSEEMKLPVTHSLQDEGADIWNRTNDHADSPYFYAADFYNMKSTDTRFILPHFKTFQQTSWWSCGPSCVMMALDYYDDLGNWNEESLAALRTDHSERHIGTCLDQMIDMLEGVGGYELVTTYDYADKPEEVSFAFFREQIQAGYPVLIGWNDWGGHWEVVIGYDTMGTDFEGDDVLIFADPFDTSDHNQDGYGVVSAERFLCNFTFYDFFPEDEPGERCFIVVKPR